MDVSDILQKMAQEPPRALSPIRKDPEASEVALLQAGQDLFTPRQEQEGYDPYNPYYRGATVLKSADFYKIPKRVQSQAQEMPRKEPEMPMNVPDMSKETGSVAKNLLRLPCTKCEWKTMALEPAYFDGLLSYLKHHEMTHHGMHTGVGNVSGIEVNNNAVKDDEIEVAELRDFQFATAPKVVPEGKDDRINLFSEGRFLMGPLNWSNLLLKAPVMQKQAYGNYDLWHLGMPYVNPKVANPLHSRAARDLKLDKFVADNLTNRDLIKLVELDNGFFVQGNNFVEADEPGELLL